MPADIGSELAGASERVLLALPSARQAPLRRALQRELLRPLESIFTFLSGMHDERPMLRALSESSLRVAGALKRAGDEEGGGAVLEHAHNIRRTLNRLHVIKRTDFLQSGAALMELLVWVTVILTVTASSDDGIIAGYANVGVTALQFFYVIELLRDIDDPYDYSADALLPVVVTDEESGEKTVGMEGAGNSAEVDPFPFMCVTFHPPPSSPKKPATPRTPKALSPKLNPHTPFFLQRRTPNPVRALN